MGLILVREKHHHFFLQGFFTVSDNTLKTALHVFLVVPFETHEGDAKKSFVETALQSGQTDGS